MATASALSTVHSVCTPNGCKTLPCSYNLPITNRFRGFPISFKRLTLRKTNSNSYPHRLKKLRSLEQDTPISEEEEEQVPEQAEQQTVSVPVSPSDILTMYLQAEGTMNEAAIPKVTKALEEIEGVTDLKVQVLESIASVELTKQTTVQATGVASGLVELIQGSGFKLQTLNLSFQDMEEDVLV